MRCLPLLCLAFVTMTPDLSALYGQEPQVPGKEHEELKATEGTWDAVLKSADGSEVQAVAEFKMTCEGMWLASDFQCDFGGQKFHGKGLDSYDSTKKQYVSVWVDSMTGSPMVLAGTKVGKITTMTGDAPGPAGTTKVKTITTHESADKMSFTMFRIEDGKDVEQMTVRYTRRKK